MAAALQVAYLSGFDLHTLNAFACVAALRVPGRFQTIQWNDRRVILDVAHNPAATAFLVERLVQNASPSSKVHAIVAMMSDKDRAQSLANLKGRVHHWYLADLSHIPRAATIGQLRQNLADLNLVAGFSGSVTECLQAALANSNLGDRILIFGSFYTVAAGLQALNIPKI